MGEFAVSSGSSGQFKHYNGRTTSYVIFTSIMAALGGMLFGYDIGISGGVTSMTSFLKKFFPHVLAKQGTGNNYCKYNNQKLQAFTSSLYIAGLVATHAAGYTSRRFGRLFTMRVAAVCFIVGAALSSGAPNLEVVILGRVFLGCGVGFANQAVPVYLSEISPVNLRGLLNNLFQLACTFGILVANLVNYGTSKIDVWGWRLALGGAGILAILMAIGLCFLPDTPNSLIERGHHEKGKKVLQKIRGVEDVENEYEDILSASQAAKQVLNPYKNILKRESRPQLIIATLLHFFQQMTGINTIMFYSPVLFETLGFKDDAALYSAVITGGVMLACTFVALFLVDRVGRRPLLLEGGVQMFLSMICIALILHFQLHDFGPLPHLSAKLVVALICVFIGGFSWSWGPIAWLIPTEIFPLETRSAGQSIIVSTDLLFTFFIAQSFLSMLCSMKYTIFLFFWAWLFVMTLFIYFFLPETKGIPIEEMQQVWGKHWWWKRYITDHTIRGEQEMKDKRNFGVTDHV